MKVLCHHKARARRPFGAKILSKGSCFCMILFIFGVLWYDVIECMGISLVHADSRRFLGFCPKTA